VTAWVNGRRARRIDCRDRGLQYGDGLFETMRVRHGVVRLLEYHLERLYSGCRRLAIEPPAQGRLRGEIARVAALRRDAVLKLIVSRGVGARGYRPSGRERCTRILCLGALPPHADPRAPVRLRICRLRLAANPGLAGLKTLNRLESVLARAEWRDPRVLEGLMLDTDGNLVCGTMSNLFVRRGSRLTTPLLDRCGVEGVMRRFVLELAPRLGLQPAMRRLRLQDLGAAEEIFMSNAVAGIMPVGEIRQRALRIRPAGFEAARALRAHLDAL